MRGMSKTMSNYSAMELEVTFFEQQQRPSGKKATNPAVFCARAPLPKIELGQQCKVTHAMLPLLFFFTRSLVFIVVTQDATPRPY